jgi:hypothetical protein
VNHMFVAEPLLAGRPLSPTMQLISTTLCWVMSVGAPLFMRAQFDVWLPSSVCVWTLLWLGMAHLLRRSPRFSGLVSGFPIWSWMQSILAGGVILPSLLLAAWSSKNGAGQDELEGFLLSTWREAPYQIYLEQVHAVLLGYFLKDFWLFYSEGLESGYALHHILSVAGCSMCLCMPGSAGLTSLQAVQVEFVGVDVLLSIATFTPHEGPVCVHHVRFQCLRWLPHRCCLSTTNPLGIPCHVHDPRRFDCYIALRGCRCQREQGLGPPPASREKGIA